MCGRREVLAHQVAPSRRRAPPHTTPQLVELGDTEPVRPEDHHHGGVGHVHTHLDDGRGHQHIEIATAERGHDRLPLGGRETPVQQTDPQIRQRARSQLGVHRLGCCCVDFVGLLDQRAHNVRLASRAHLGAQALPDGGLLERFGDGGGAHAGPTGGKLVEARHVEIAVDRHGRGPRDGRGRHDEDIGQPSPGAALAQRGTLLHPEAVLLVDDGEPQGPERHLLADERVRAHHHGHVSGGQAAQDAAAGRCSGSPRQQLHRHGKPAESQAPVAGDHTASEAVERPQQVVQTQVVLLGQHLCRRHQRRLATA